MIMLSIEDVLLIAKKLIERFGGTFGIRNKGLLESSLNNAFQTFDGEELYKTDVEKIAVISYSIIRNHPMIDGNKRLGISVLLILCKLNNIILEYTREEAVDLAVRIAEGSIDIEDVVEWIKKHEKK
ncbi:death-on-curing family protein [Caldicellulosiruptor obsidiansis OB47]|uniref:Death-on-curing family protein n=1 Tax=Caldicellulosiruptor obsidiansis (strain ATCC BAA-2073 / JCM 16842 / OB47) TaxID=608506 RepID=D9TGQ3_CALOO|nr:type II toxin-antitoxin system death-on-curing family toxin [Caldicellulosiruptor obsidiansis]ADL41389.1 death-on-curing family protein [Caldicellulosiruptor obsidiansis OB47]